MITEPTHPRENHESPEGGSTKELVVNIQAWLAYFLSKWRILLLAGLLGGALGLAYSFWRQPLFKATTTFVLEASEGKGALSQYAGMAAMVGIDLGGSTGGLFQGDNILELYRSRKMLTQTLLSKTYPDSNELLIDRYIIYNGLRDKWTDEPVLAELDFRREPTTLTPQYLRTRDSVLTDFVNAINEDILRVSKLDPNLSIVTVETTAPDEVFAKVFNENLVRHVNDFYVQTKTKKSANHIAILQQKVDSVRAVMEGAIYSAARVSDATPNLNPTRQVQRIAPTQEAQFSAETNKVMLSQLLQNLELSKMNLLQEQPLIQLVDQPVYPLLVDRVGKVKGIVVGGLLLGFLTLFAIGLLKYYRDIMKGE